VHGEEAAILETHEVELALRERCNATGLKPFNRASDLHIGPIDERRVGLAGKQCGNGDPAGFEDSQATEDTYRTAQEATLVRVYVCHGHIRVMPAPRNHAPVAVRMANATNNNTKHDCTASSLVAAKVFLINT